MPMTIESIGLVAGALAVALLLSLITTPIVKSLAQKWGAVDVPKDNRRMHDHPIPRMGGLAIFFGFVLSVILFLPFLGEEGLDPQVRGMLLGAVVIVVLGIFDDIYALPALPKLIVQIVAAIIAVASGNLIEVISNPNIFSADPYWELGWLSYPVTVIWIVAVTNAVNLIDGLDGLACGVSTISSMTMLVIALAMAEPQVAILMAALAGGCLGFLPYNLNPAKIFMGDMGSLAIGASLAAVSLLLHHEWSLLVIGIVYVCETASVMLQVASFKLTGKRIFKMSPIHHHFEMCGWSEWKIDIVFWSVGLLAAIIAVATIILV